MHSWSAFEVRTRLESDATSLVAATDDLLWKDFFMTEKNGDIPMSCNVRLIPYFTH